LSAETAHLHLNHGVTPPPGAAAPPSSAGGGGLGKGPLPDPRPVPRAGGVPPDAAPVRLLPKQPRQPDPLGAHLLGLDVVQGSLQVGPQTYRFLNREIFGFLAAMVNVTEWAGQCPNYARDMFRQDIVGIVNRYYYTWLENDAKRL
jgi:hypothetical protein